MKNMQITKEKVEQTARPRSRAEAKAQSREALIESAMALIPTRGLDVSLDELCAHAGYTRGAFYQHFEDRDALIAAVTGQFAEHLFDSVINKKTGESAFDLASIANSVLGLLQRGEYPIGRGGVMRSYQLLQACDRSPVVRQQYFSIYEKTLSKFTELVRQAQDQGAISRTFDVDALAALGIALIVGLRTLNDVGVPIDLDALKRLFNSVK
jgi:AcrR family transcriptional regulator